MSKRMQAWLVVSTFMLKTRVSLMAKKPKLSAGLLLFRRVTGKLEVFLAHPGGWRVEGYGCWGLDPSQGTAQVR